MDTQRSEITVAEAVGRLIGSAVVGIIAVGLLSLILFVSWNRSIPDVLGGSEITLAQSMYLLGVVWSLSFCTRIKA